MYRLPVAFLLVLLPQCFLLVSCGGSNIDPLPQGEQTISGVLKAAELSVTRRGTHIIEQEGVETYYAESTLVNLREYQDKLITLRGTLEHNISTTDLPVIVVSSIVDIEETVKEYSFPYFGLELSAPKEWQSIKRAGDIQFLASDIEEAVVTISQEKGATLPEGGVPVVVDATRATRLIDEFSGTQIVAIKRKDSILTFTFNPHGSVRAETLREEFLAMISSVSFKSDNDSDDKPNTGTGALGIPCGGAAGILCPAGHFCDVKNLEENIGRCKKL